MNKMMQNGLLVASLSAAVLAGVFVGRSGPNPHQAQGGLKTTFLDAHANEPTFAHGNGPTQ